jgi:hypothetical protein
MRTRAAGAVEVLGKRRLLRSWALQSYKSVTFVSSVDHAQTAPGTDQLTIKSNKIKPVKRWPGSCIISRTPIPLLV